jgi:single-stranded-DNA-specific exonuclease
LIEKKWIQRPQIPQKISDSLSDYPLPFRQILFNRGIEDKLSALEFLSANEELHNPFLFKGMDIAVKRIEKAINNHERIVIFGDYDVDGITSSVLLNQVLRKLGAYVKTYIPNRLEEGYGLSKESLEGVFKLQPDLIITVDCGIRSFEEIDIAKTHHIDIIVTDHHQPKEKVPDAAAVICSKQEGDAYPYKELAGVGVAYKLAQALFMELETDWINIWNWLDLVAIGTVADVAPLNGENRALVRKGIDIIRQKSRMGILALCEVSKVNILKFNSYNIGFMLGPRLNAAGRLSTALTA